MPLPALFRSCFISTAFCHFFATLCDISLQWSFGVVLWESLTGAANPYPSISNYDLKAYLQSGQRLDKPINCPSQV